MLKKLGIVIVLLIAIQFFPYGKNHTNPAVVGEPHWDSPQTQKTFYRVCGNCHSNKTKWPWYSSIAPVSWLVQSDVDEGRQHFNASMWGQQKMNRGQDAAGEVGGGDMPPWYYVLGHPEAKLSDSQRATLAKGLKATFGEEGK
jgi:mono/diheme cytochrome c family protein